MKHHRRAIEEVAHTLGLHRTIQRIYRQSFARSGGQASEHLLRFYKPLLHSGSLVFDIGANTGKYSEVFDLLGARVVAVEPNEGCARHIELSYPRVHVLQAAIGGTNGLIDFHISDCRDDLGSASEEWLKLLTTQHSEYTGIWNRKITVPCVTLDELSKHFGNPDYIKIDVEGYEQTVLSGLSSQPQLISFEFNTADLRSALVCLEKLSPNSIFNLSIGDRPAFVSPEWIKKDRLTFLLRSMPTGEQHGDIFARLVPSS